MRLALRAQKCPPLSPSFWFLFWLLLFTIFLIRFVILARKWRTVSSELHGQVSRFSDQPERAVRARACKALNGRCAGTRVPSFAFHSARPRSEDWNFR